MCMCYNIMLIVFDCDANFDYNRLYVFDSCGKLWLTTIKDTIVKICVLNFWNPKQIHVTQTNDGQTILTHYVT